MKRFWNLIFALIFLILGIIFIIQGDIFWGIIFFAFMTMDLADYFIENKQKGTEK